MLSFQDISIIIPAFNEEEGIGTVLKAITSEPLLTQAEVIVVNDGSTDETVEIVKCFPQVLLLQHRINKGYGASLVTGILAASRKFVIWFDADGQHRVEDLVQIANELIENDLDYCIGIRDSKSYQDPKREIGKFLLRLAITFASGKNVKDFNSGLRGFKTTVILPYLPLLPRGFGASTTTTLLMLKRGCYGKEVAITVTQRVGKSSVKYLRDGLRTLQIILRLFVLFSPMRFFGGIGFSLMIVGMVYGLIRGLLARQGFPVFGALTVILGVQSLFFGVISDQISLLRLDQLEREIRNGQ